MKWEIEEGGTLGQGGEHAPTQYPRTNEERDAVSKWNKGGASQNELPGVAIRTNTTGDETVPRHGDNPIDYYDMGDGKDVYASGFNTDESAGRDEQG